MFRREGRLAQRPLAPLDAELTAHGMRLEDRGSDLLCSGQLRPGGYSLLHGEAVAMGLSAIARASAVRGICSSETADCIIALLHKYGLPTEIPFSASELRREMLRDKKRSGNTLKLIVPEAIGRCRTETVPVGDLESWLRDGGVS